MTVSLPLGRAEIEEILPHREPFLLIDEVLELTPGVGAVARKRVRDDEANPLISILRLSGITRVEDGCLRVRNQIYSQVFDPEWEIGRAHV